MIPDDCENVPVSGVARKLRELKWGSNSVDPSNWNGIETSFRYPSPHFVGHRQSTRFELPQKKEVETTTVETDGWTVVRLFLPKVYSAAILACERLVHILSFFWVSTLI